MTSDTAPGDTEQLVVTGESCPDCGQRVRTTEVVDLPRQAIMAELYDICVFDAEDLPAPWWGRTVVVYHGSPAV